MSIKDQPFTIGIEEEYLLVDRETRDLATDPPADLMKECQKRLRERVMPEFLKAQIEVGTGVCKSLADARRDLCELRRTVVEVADGYGLAPIAAATHPFASWEEQKLTDKERYNILARDLQAVARRLLICGLHVHVGIDDDDLRIDLMNQVAYFLPHMLALSTSSPFWKGEETGLMSYRLTVFDGLPRTGLPDAFDSYAEYQRLVDSMVQAGLIEDATKLWWDVRVSARFPTLEMRLTDVCTHLEDAITIAALYVCTLSMLTRLRQQNQRWRVYPRSLVNENRWLAQRYGTDEGMVDFGVGQRKNFPDLMDELIEYLREDAERFDCVAEVEHARTIVKRGTSAHQQVRTYHEAMAGGASKDEALRGVVDMLVKTTREGIDEA